MTHSPLSERQEEVEAPVFWKVFDRAVSVLRAAEVPFVLIGGIPSAAHGYPRWSHRTEDIDLLVRPDDAESALEALSDAGFATERTEEDWIFKALMSGVLVDLIFRVGGSMELDDEMVARVRVERFEDRTIEMVGPEDLAVMLAATYEEGAPGRLKNFLGILAHADLDWDYLLARAGARLRPRLLAFLIYAASKDIMLPRRVIVRLLQEERLLEAAS
ncbi:MAG: nucleotidyltransferase family protein [Actinomycetota bacterium]